MIERLRSYVLGGRQTEVVHECRDCGTGAPPDETTCPACGSTDFARYEIE
jgi:uncharacterized OB-fold protein